MEEFSGTRQKKKRKTKTKKMEARDRGRRRREEHERHRGIGGKEKKRIEHAIDNFPDARAIKPN